MGAHIHTIFQRYFNEWMDGWIQAKNVAEKDLERKGPDFYQLLNQPISAILCNRIVSG